MPDDYTEHYLLIYGNIAGRLLDVRAFSAKDVIAADDAYALAEAQYPGDDFEVVLVSADSLDTIKRTHGHYFTDSSDPLARLTFV